MFAAMGFLLGTQERVRNIRGTRAISVRATEVLLYVLLLFVHHTLSFIIFCHNFVHPS